MMTDIEEKNYSIEELSTILKDAGVKPNSYKTVRVVIQLVPNGWLYGVTGYSKSSGIMCYIVKGWETESGSQYLSELCDYPLKVKVLETPIPQMTLYREWK